MAELWIGLRFIVFFRTCAGCLNAGAWAAGRA